MNASALTHQPTMDSDEPAPSDAGRAAQWRSAMLRFAQLHIQPREDAEDAVQDALAALLSVNPASLAGTDLRRYAFGILKHKITDRLRQRYRREIHVQHEPLDDALDDTLFNDRGHWADGVEFATWSPPEEQLHNDQFFTVVDLCVNRLPTKPARVFSMKAFLECEADEICDTLGLSKTDYWQCMSRARKQLQLCLSQHWFDQHSAPPHGHLRSSKRRSA